MEMSGTQLLAAPPEAVWARLLDGETLKACIPGCRELVGSPAEGFEATVVQKVGPVKATFRGRVEFEGMQAPTQLVLRGEGKGGAAGFAKGGAQVTLVPEGDGVRLTYEVDAKVGGKLAQLGSRIINGFAKKMADQFFERFSAEVAGPQEPVQEAS